MRSIKVDDQEVLKNLEHRGSKKNLKAYTRSGASESTFGVSMSTLRKIAKAILIQKLPEEALSSLAKKLWASGYTEAKMLASIIYPPESATMSQLNSFADSIDFYPLADIFVDELVIKSKWALDLMHEWKKSDHEFKIRCAYRILKSMAEAENEYDETFFLDELYLLETLLPEAPNWAKHAMHEVLLATGKRNRKLNTVSLAISRRLGPIDIEFTIDHFKVFYAERILSDKKLQKKLPD